MLIAEIFSDSSKVSDEIRITMQKMLIDLHS